MSLDIEPVALSSLFTNSLSIIREKAAARQVRVTLEASAELGLIHADGRKLKQIVYNLLSNAVKFTHDGGQVTLHATLVERAAVGQPSGAWPRRTFALADNEFTHFLEIRISDTGIGISSDGLERIFKPFSQIDSGLARRFEGTGLGLAMVKLLVELHGGAVAVESSEGHGSCFTVWLPQRQGSAGASTAVAAIAPRREPRPGVANGARVALVVEDDLRSAALIRLQLETEGFEVLHASSAEQALVMAVQQPLSLITLDIMLPAMDGWACLAAIRQVPSLRQVPVVVISIVADRSRGLSLGPAAVLQKPILRPELYASLVELGLFPLPTGQPLKILIADDDPEAVELIAAQLSELTSSVLRASDGHQAIALAGSERPDLVILDLVMPGLSGFEVVATLAGNPDTASIPVVVVASSAVSADERATLNQHVTAIVDKATLDRDHFRAEVRRAVAGRQRTE